MTEQEQYGFEKHEAKVWDEVSNEFREFELDTPPQPNGPGEQYNAYDFLDALNHRETGDLVENKYKVLHSVQRSGTHVITFEFGDRGHLGVLIVESDQS